MRPAAALWRGSAHAARPGRQGWRRCRSDLPAVLAWGGALEIRRAGHGRDPRCRVSGHGGRWRRPAPFGRQPAHLVDEPVPVVCGHGPVRAETSGGCCRSSVSAASADWASVTIAPLCSRRLRTVYRMPSSSSTISTRTPSSRRALLAVAMSSMCLTLPPLGLHGLGGLWSTFLVSAPGTAHALP